MCDVRCAGCGVLRVLGFMLCMLSRMLFRMLLCALLCVLLCVLLCILEAMEGELRSLEVLE